MKIALTVAGLGLLLTSAHAQWARFTFTSDPGDWVGGGQSLDILYTPENTVFFSAQAMKWGDGPGPNFVRFSMMREPVSTYFLSADFGTNMLGIPMQPGVYENAQRASFADPGHPGLDVSFEHRGSNTVMGRFVVQEAVFTQIGATDWRVDRFRVDFEQHSEGGTPAMHGTLIYSAVPEPASIAALALGAAVLLRRRRRR